MAPGIGTASLANGGPPRPSIVRRAPVPRMGFLDATSTLFP
jgi:hypothetical protein